MILEELPRLAAVIAVGDRPSQKERCVLTLDLAAQRKLAGPSGEIAVDPTMTAEVPAVQLNNSEDGSDLGGDDDDPVDDSELDPMGLDESTSRPTAGHIVLAASIDDLSQPCGTVLQIEPDGTGSVTNHLNETIQVTPVGVTEAFAHDMATRIADILTDSFL